MKRLFAFLFAAALVFAAYQPQIARADTYIWYGAGESGEVDRPPGGSGIWDWGGGAPVEMSDDLNPDMAEDAERDYKDAWDRYWVAYGNWVADPELYGPEPIPPVIELTLDDEFDPPQLVGYRVLEDSNI